MSMMTGTITVRGQEFEVTMDPEWKGTFCTTVGGKRIESKSWKSLQSAIGTELRKADVAVEVRFLDPRSYRIGTATKIHSSTKNVMVRWDGESGTEQVNGEVPMHPDTDVAELRRLREAHRNARNELSEFEDKARLRRFTGLRDLVEEAQREKAAELEAAEAKGDVEPIELDA